MSPLRSDISILIADDHALVRRGLREFLRDFFVEDGLAPHIIETGSAQNAIAQIRATAWDLVILDLNLPDMPGLEILRILKSLQPTAAVLVVSIYAEEHYATRAVRAGALGYLTKDTGPQELRTAVSASCKMNTISALMEPNAYWTQCRTGMPRAPTPFRQCCWTERLRFSNGLHRGDV